MPARRNPEERFRASIARHFDGAAMSIANARGLLQAASDVSGSSPASASFLASMAVEEGGKALLLMDRAHSLLYNAEVRVFERVFADEPEWASGVHQLRQVPAWGVFAGRNGTHSGGLHDHVAKLDALRNHYAATHEHIVSQTDDTIVVSPVDMFQGVGANGVRGIVEKSLYVCWDGHSKSWLAPRPCIVDIGSFVTAIGSHLTDLAELLSGERGRSAGQIDYLTTSAASAHMPLHLAFPAD